jgi:hypothetical protein
MGCPSSAFDHIEFMPEFNARLIADAETLYDGGMKGNLLCCNIQVKDYLVQHSGYAVPLFFGVIIH